MANVTIPKKIEQLFVNTIHKHYGQDVSKTLDWYYDRPKRGTKTVKYLFVPSDNPVDIIHPINEDGKQFCPAVSPKGSIYVKVQKGGELLYEVGTRIYYSLFDLGFTSKKGFLRAYDLEENRVSGYLVSLTDSKPKPVTVDLKTLANGSDIQKRHKVIIDVMNNYIGSYHGLNRLIIDSLTEAGLTNIDGTPYSHSQVSGMKRSKRVAIGVKNPPVFVKPPRQRSGTKKERYAKSKKNEYYYPNLIRIYSTIFQYRELKNRDIAHKLTVRKLYYKEDTPFTSAIVTNFKLHAEYKDFEQEKLCNSL